MPHLHGDGLARSPGLCMQLLGGQPSQASVGGGYGICSQQTHQGKPETTTLAGGGTGNSSPGAQGDVHATPIQAVVMAGSMATVPARTFGA